MARQALKFLAETRHEDLVTRAIDLTASPGERLGAGPMAVVMLAVLILQVELRIERNSDGRWRFQLHKQPMRNSTLGCLLAILLTASHHQETDLRYTVTEQYLGGPG